MFKDAHILPLTITHSPPSHVCLPQPQIVSWEFCSHVNELLGYTELGEIS